MENVHEQRPSAPIEVDPARLCVTVGEACESHMLCAAKFLPVAGTATQMSIPGGVAVSSVM